MKIVVLDGKTANPGDLDWSALEEMGELVVHDRTADDQRIGRSAGAEAVLTNKTVLDADVLSELPQLRYVGVLATGYNVVDLAVARQRGVVVTNVPAYSTESVAQHTFALLLELVSRVAEHSASVHRGDWAACEDFSYTLTPPGELSGRTLGLVGLGQIGSRVADIGLAMGMRVIATTRTGRGRPDVPAVAFDQLLADSDVVSLHCPLTDETRGLIDAAALAGMKPSAFLINTSRGPVIDEQAVRDALDAGKLAGVGVDVLRTEPPSADNPLLGAPNCVVTPHLAWATVEARRRLLAIAADNLRAFLSGKPVNVVNA
jgi:glycerate dehydrogenase